MPTPPICQIVPLGVIAYRHAQELQLRVADGVRSAGIPNTLLLLEHPPVITRGRLGTPDHIRMSPEELASRGISLCDTDRGGQVTFHGPGQLVAYPIVNLRGWGGPVRYVRTLEQVIIQTLGDLGIQAHLVDGLTGVWVDGAKIGAIGVKISGGVAFHGLSINVNTDLSYYDNIVPCGIEDRPVTSMSQSVGQSVDEDLVRYSLSYQFGRAMGFTMVEGELDPWLAGVGIKP